MVIVAALPACGFAAVLYFLIIVCFHPLTWTALVEPWILRPPVDVFGMVELDRERLAFACGASIMLEAVFWAAQGLLYAVYRQPSLYACWHLPKSQPYPSAALMKKCVDDLIPSHALRPLLLWLVYPVYRWRATSFSAAQLPDPLTLLLHLAIAIAVDDTLFYWAHRLLHENKWLYRTVHKQHHEFKHAVGLATEYAHPAEDLLCNATATLAGPLLLGSHAAVVVGYTAIKLWQSVDAHSSLHLPFPLTPWNVLPGMDCSRAHDFHHSHNVGCYGGFFSFWDRICGTDAAYRRFVERSKAQ